MQLDQTQQEHEPTDHSPVFGKGMLTILAWTAVLTAGYLLWAFSLPATKSDGSCDGIGFGCTPNPQDGALLVGMIIGVPVLSGVVIVAVLILVALTKAKLKSGVWAGTLAMFSGLVVSAAVALVWFS